MYCLLKVVCFSLLLLFLFFLFEIVFKLKSLLRLYILEKTIHMNVCTDKIRKNEFTQPFPQLASTNRMLYTANFQL